MKGIYYECMDRVSLGVPYSIDFEKRTLILGGEKIIDNGKYDGDLHFGLNNHEVKVMSMIEALYRIYKHSIPSEKTEAKRRTYFKALKEEELSDEDMMYGDKRMVCMFDLEYYILASILDGSLTWDESWGWFWQSEKDKDLVILRSWVVGE